MSFDTELPPPPPPPSLSLYQESASVFRDKFQCYLEEFRANPMSGSITNGSEGTTYDSFTYDAVWTTALGLDETDR